MSTLGKILTVLVVLVAIPVSVLVSRELVMGQNWHARYLQAQDQFSRAIGQRDDYHRTAQDANRLRETEKSALQTTINDLQNDKTELQHRLDVLDGDKAALDKRLSTLSDSFDAMSKQLAQLTTERQEARAERDEAKRITEDYRKMYADLDTEYQDVRAKFAETEETIRILREEKADLEARYADAVRKGYKPPAAIVEPTHKLTGLVTAADTANQTAEVNLGSDDGVASPMVFYVYDPKAGEFLAKLTIKQVAHDRAVGDLSMIRGTVEVGNHVTNRFD